MKKPFVAFALCSLLLTMGGMYSCSKKSETTITNHKQVNSDDFARLKWLSKVLSWLGFDIPTVEVSFRSGYYEGTPTPVNPDAFKCNPGDGMCELIVTAGGGLVIPPTNETYPEDQGLAVFAIQNGDLKMVIDKASLHPNTYANLYQDGIMTIPGPWELQEEITTALGLPSGYTIPQGDYDIATVQYEDGDPESVGDLLVITF